MNNNKPSIETYAKEKLGANSLTEYFSQAVGVEDEAKVLSDLVLELMEGYFIFLSELENND